MSSPSHATPVFNYPQAYSRNIGWVTQAEQARLRKARIAIAGLGGVGTVGHQSVQHFRF